ncbi:unnamed protein product [Paramecium octaurelia]|uniref:Tetratricopeptide repeat protein n=1 Tax=Paramecium octaurelia TaxID=43137 RepID=A0A8S1X5K5_PAROT|nr:unnamed protein product [Paramecium octaurelia]
MGQQGNLKLKCQQYDHKDEIETICYNQFCQDFRLNCFKCDKRRTHHDHINDVEKINSLIGFIENRNKECDNLIDNLDKYVESLNQSFSQLKRGIKLKYSLQKERLINLNSQQLNDYLNSTIKFMEYKHSITTIISDQAKKLNHTFNNIYEQLQLLSLNYYQIDDNSIKQSEKLYDKGYDLYQKYKYTEAIDILDISIQQNPKNYKSQGCKGACLMMLNKYEDAINWLDQALAIDPKNVFSLRNKGACLMMLNNYEGAINLLDQALAIDPKDVFSLRNKGECLRMLNKYEDAINQLDQALAINPKDFFSLRKKGECLRMQNQYDDAINWLDQALAIDPKDVFSLNSKSKCLRILKQYSESFQFLDQTNVIDTQAIHSKGDDLADQLKQKKALIHCEQSSTKNSNDLQSQYQQEFCQQIQNQ